MRYHVACVEIFYIILNNTVATAVLFLSNDLIKFKIFRVL